MKRLTGSSRWRSGVGVVGAGLLVATLGVGVTSALAADEQASDSRTVAQVARPTPDRSVKTEDVKTTDVKTTDVKTTDVETKKETKNAKTTDAGTKPRPAARTTAKTKPAPKQQVPAAAKKTPAPKRTNHQSPVQRLEALARDVVRPSGGTVTVTGRDENVPSVDVRVETAAGRWFELTVRYSDDPDGVETAREACRLDQQEQGRTCTTLRSTADLGVWSREYSTQPGRESLWLVATARDDMSLWVQFTNYVETPDGSKEVGPGWQDVGITVSGLRQAVVRSGLTVVRN